MTRALALPLTLALLGSACAPSPGARDASTNADAPVDAPLRPLRSDAGTTIYTTCASPADCPTGFVCDRQYPFGLCTLGCTSHADCPEAGRCIDAQCVPTCRPGGGEWCREDQLCDPVIRACVVSCSQRADLPELGCTIGACLSNDCRTTLPGPGPLGAACTADADCASLRCALSTEGFLDGMCVMATRMLGADAWLDDGPMPAGRCPEGSAVGSSWLANSIAAGELALCLPRCVADGDCRDGYYCERRGAWDAPLHTDGYCAPWPCALRYVPRCEPPHVCSGDVVGPGEASDACVTPP